MWEDESLIVVRNHNSKLDWATIASLTQLDLFPFNDIKAIAPVRTKKNKSSWLQRRMLKMKGESIYFNDWNPQCNKVELNQAVWFNIFSLLD